MAFDFSKLNIFNFFNKLNARSRVLFLAGSVIVFSLIIYFGTKLIFGTAKTTGPSKVAAAPQGLQSVPGGNLNPEYQRALMQANIQSGQQAQITGGSAVPTLINFGGQANQAGCIICTEQSANVKNLLDDWVRQGKVPPEVAQALERLAEKNIAISDYAAELQQLVKKGILQPDQARMLLDEYKKQHAAKLLKDSGQQMDALIKAGQLSLEVANILLTAQKGGISSADYSARLQEFVRQGNLAPDVSQTLLSQYSQQRAHEIIGESINTLHQMTSNGQISAEVEKVLIDLETRMVPVDEFNNTLQGFITGGKIIPVIAAKILDEYKGQKAAIGPSNLINQMLERAQEAAYAEIQDLLKAGKISQDVANQLISMIQKNVSLADYQKFLNQLVAEKKMTPEIAKLKIGDYSIIKALREQAERLAALQANNASAADYANELKRAVQAGLLTPEQAAQLMQQYQALTARPAVPIAAGAGTEAFAQLQKRAQQGAVAAVPVTPTEFAPAVTEAQQGAAQQRQANIEALIAAMSGQAQQLIAAWQPPTMQHKEGTTLTTTKTVTKGTTTTTTAGGTTTTTTIVGPAAPPIIKAGTILFSVLDSEANSDYPDSPILATIVEGPFKGAKLLGKLVVTTSQTGQMDRISLNFTLMNMDQWTQHKNVTAYAIDPDTARTAIASTVNYHYLLRFGAMLATSLLQGYAGAINSSSSTTTTGIFGTSTTHPQLNPSSKVMVALGQAGQTLGAATQNYVNTPPTVRVDPGVSLGILFMADVT